MIWVGAFATPPIDLPGPHWDLQKAFPRSTSSPNTLAAKMAGLCKVQRHLLGCQSPLPGCELVRGEPCCISLS